jgi:hypothetical protein
MRLSQMYEASVSRLALPGCVKVGDSGKNYLEASLQLGIWCFAGLAKLDELRVQSRTTGRKLLTPAMIGQISAADSEQNLPVFGWTAIGMDWKLHIAYRDTTDDGVMILGPLDSGGLGSVMALFKLFRTATALAKWAKEKYWLEFKSIVEA